MAVYEIKSPQGEVFEVTAPDDATEDQVLSYAQQNMHQQQEPSFLEQAKHYSGLGARAVYRGAAGLADIIPGAVNVAQIVEEKLTGKPTPRLPMPASELMEKYLNAIDVPEPQTGVQRLASDVITGATGGAGFGQKLVGAMGGAGAGAARELGAGEFGQVVGGALGGGTPLALRRSRARQKQMTSERLGELSGEAFDEARYIGATFDEPVANKFVSEAEKLKPAQIAGKYTPENEAIIKDIDDFTHVTGHKLSLDDIQSIDRALNLKINKRVDARTGELDPHGKTLYQLQSKLRDIIDKIPDMPGMEALNRAKKLWSAKRRLQDLEDIAERASMSLNPATALQTGYRNLYMNGSRTRGWSKRELKLLKKAATPGLTDDALAIIGSRLNTIASAASGGGLSGAAAAHMIGIAGRGLRGKVVSGRGVNLANEMVNSAVKEAGEPTLGAEPLYPLRLSPPRPRSETISERYFKEQGIAERERGPTIYGDAPKEQLMLPSPTSLGMEFIVGSTGKTRRATNIEEATANLNRQKEIEMGMTAGVRRNISRLKIRKELGPVFDNLEAKDRQRIMFEVNKSWLDNKIPIIDVIAQARHRANELAAAKGEKLKSTAMSEALLKAGKKQ